MSIAPLDSGPWTVRDLARLPDDARYELLDGGLLASPRERLLNARASALLAEQVRRHLTHRWMAEREVEIWFDDGTCFIADVAVFLRNPTRSRQALGFAATDVGLAVEIESPTSRRRDRFLKPPVYAEAGIPHFWRVELEPQPRLLAHALVGGAYELVADITASRDVELLGVTVGLDVAALTG